MKALFRSLLLWFLLAGIPFQGFASATMLLCAPAVPENAAPMKQGTHHDHAAMLAAQAQPDDGAAAHHAAAGHAKCASAAACCTGAPLLPSLPAAPPALDGRCAIVPFVLTAPAAVDLAGFDRPPKSQLA
ncbi:hypothetical protein IP92_04788 [Pseudoduganella flava]|uniref:CopL family metal-binding regulatory protein n=1 Tax=Pseudoduganella flava TaxID=871742 RepID=A0A562PH02_9BURK|nr:hypothetical protein [Pseudoduganella flava]QGZ42582.1 hypothetical protein GO485_28470 [Pseudoduganella flava]TWI43735.1 hypothetical protein IP92_04788 [Pseudoduganella flava]